MVHTFHYAIPQVVLPICITKIFLVVNVGHCTFQFPMQFEALFVQATDEVIDVLFLTCPTLGCKEDFPWLNALSGSRVVIYLVSFYFSECGSDLTGPKAVRAVLGSSVTVKCHYDQRYQGNMKYWCRRMRERNCPPVIRTTGSELPVTKNRVSIQDNHSLSLFTVTMGDLTSSDSGMYSCAVSQAGGRDLMTPVNVTGRSPEKVLALTSLQKVELDECWLTVNKEHTECCKTTTIINLGDEEGIGEYP